MQQTKNPYRKHIFVCTNLREGAATCCARRGSGEIRDVLKRYVGEHGLAGIVRVSQSGCQGLCEQGPNVMVFPEGTWYHHVTPGDLETIIQAHLAPLRDRAPADRPPATIRAILFDLGNVLLPFDHMRAAKALAPYANHHPEHLYHAFFDSPIQALHDEGKISGQEFFARAQDLYGLRMSYEQFVAAWNDIFWEDAEMTRLVQRLKPLVPLLGISNTNQLHFEAVRQRFPVIRHIQTWVLSHEVGARKPERAIYERAIHAAGVGPEEILYLDDRLDLVEAGRALGLRAEVFVNAERLQAQLAVLGMP